MTKQYDENHRFSHFRVIEADGTIAPQGGASVAYTQVGDRLFCAAAYCSPRDNFSYQSGRIKSSARLGNLVARPEKEDGNKYFTFKLDGNDVAAGVRAIRDHMVDGLGYATRYGSAAQE